MINEYNTVQEIITYLKPLVQKAGHYALNIQARVASQPLKQGMDNPFFTALTDADLSVQAFIEVALLAKYPNVKFYGEEYDQSLNMKYFSENEDICIYLDPIDGTRYFQDNLKEFNIITTIANKTEILGALIFIPAYKVFFSAVRGIGSFIESEEDCSCGKSAKPLNTAKNGELIITYELDGICQSLREKFDVVDVAASYTPEKGCPSTNSILLGDSSALISRGPSLIDWGAIGFVIEQAGGIVSDFNGNALPPISNLTDLRFPELLICTTNDIQKRILNCMHSK